LGSVATSEGRFGPLGEVSGDFGVGGDFGDDLLEVLRHFRPRNFGQPRLKIEHRQVSVRHLLTQDKWTLDQFGEFVEGFLDRLLGRFDLLRVRIRRRRIRDDFRLLFHSRLKMAMICFSKISVQSVVTNWSASTSSISPFPANLHLRARKRAIVFD